MAKGHRDYMTWSGRSVGGESLQNYSFLIEVGDEELGSWTFPVVPVGKEYIIESLIISEPEDEFIHYVLLKRTSDNWVFFWSNLINHELYNFPGQGIGAGDSVTISVYNSSGENVEFVGTLSWVERSV